MSTAIVVVDVAAQSKSSFDSKVPLAKLDKETVANDQSATTRLFIGALLSMLDMATDIVSIVNFLRASQVGFAKSLIIMLVLNMLMQLSIVFIQHSKRGVRVLLFEAILTITCISPGVHAFRLARYHEKHSEEPSTSARCS